MMISHRFLRSLVSLSALAAVIAVGAGPAGADPVKCQRQIVRQLFRYKNTYLQKHRMCLEKEHLGRIAGPCPDPATQLRLAYVNGKVVEAIERVCTLADIQALGYRSDCAYEAATTGIEGQCAALPVSDVATFTECLKCWKSAELSEFIAILFASNAVEECGGALDETSPQCSDLDCTTPLPVQRNLGDTGENDCQKGIARAGVRYLLQRERVLEACALKGGTSASCLADLTVQSRLQRAETAKETAIQRACGQRAPDPDPPFCCRTGMGNQCTVFATRDDCVTGGGDVMEGKTCNTSTNDCDPVGGPNQTITWWGYCPESDTCPGTPLASRDDLVACVDSSADAVVDELLCLQLPGGGWPSPTDSP